MKYRTENELEHFCFSEAHIERLEYTSDLFRLYLDNVGILPENSCNRDIRNMRTNGFVLHITEMKILSFVKEGYTYYNADGKFMKKDPDEKIEEADYAEAFLSFSDGYLVELQKKQEEKNIYTFTMDAAEEGTYELTVAGTGDVEEWDRFLSIENF